MSIVRQKFTHAVTALRRKNARPEGFQSSSSGVIRVRDGRKSGVGLRRRPDVHHEERIADLRGRFRDGCGFQTRRCVDQRVPVTANSVATAGPLGTTIPNGYNFDTIRNTNITTGNASTINGTYDRYATANSGGTNTYRFISVTATQNLNLSFLPVLQASTTMPVSARAIAGQQVVADVTNAGLVPSAPDVRTTRLTPRISVSYRGKNTRSSGVTDTPPARAMPGSLTRLHRRAMDS